MSAAPRVDTAPGRLQLVRVAYTRLARIREERVLRLRNGGAVEDPTAGRDALILACARQAEALGISAVNLLYEAVLAEYGVRAFERGTERRPGRALVADLYDNRRLAFVRLSPKSWKELDVLKEILYCVPNALSCWRVRQALHGLRTARRLHAERDRPREMRQLLRRIGEAIADPKKIKSPWARDARETERDARETEIMDTWERRGVLSPNARSQEAKKLGLGSNPSKKEESDAWSSVERQARRYIARARAKKPAPPSEGG